MQYFGGGYPGLYFPIARGGAPVSHPADLELEIPLVIVTGGETRVVTITRTTAVPMRLDPMMTIPMPHGLTARAALPMRVQWRAPLDPLSALMFIEIPVDVVTGGTTRPVTIARETTQPLAVHHAITIPMTRGMAEQIEIPMQVTTAAHLEKD